MYLISDIFNKHIRLQNTVKVIAGLVLNGLNFMISQQWRWKSNSDKIFFMDKEMKVRGYHFRNHRINPRR